MTEGATETAFMYYCGWSCGWKISQNDELKERNCRVVHNSL